MTVELPEGWDGSRLESILETTIVGVWGRDARSDEVDVDVLRVTELKANGLLEPSTAARRSVSAKQVASRSLKVGDIILEKSGGGPKSPVGRVGHITKSTEGFLFSNFMQLLRPDSSQVIPNYLFQFLVYFQATGQTSPMQTATTNIRNIKMPDYLAIAVPKPPLPEQERIVEILEEQFSRLDSALASVKAVREKAKAFRRSLLHSAFSGELTGGTEGWREVALGEIAKWGSGGTPKGKNPKFYGGEIPWAIIGDLNDGVINETAEKITQEGLDNSSAKWVPENSVLIAMYGSIGKLGINAIPLTTNQAIAFAVPDEALTLTKYLYFVLMNERQRLVKEGKGATQQNISQTILKPWQIPLPPLAEQERIVEILEEQFSRLDNALEVANQLEARIAAERRSLLHSAFTGELTAKWRATHV